MAHYGIRYVPSWVERDGYVEQIPLRSAWTDNGVYCELAVWDETAGYWRPIKDVSMHCRRYGSVNSAKKGVYNLEYKFENYPIGDGGVTPKFIKNYGGGDGADVIKRTVEVCEPNWLESVTPPHYQWFPIVRQTIERYSEIYWELNYRADWVRLGLENRMLPCERHTSDFMMPVGRIIEFDESGMWYTVTGYNFKAGQTVAVIDPSAAYNGAEFDFTELAVLQVMPDGKKRAWSQSGRAVGDGPSGSSYERGDYVVYLDKDYICNVPHKINADKLSKTNLIIPGAGDVDERGRPYWVLACKIRLAQYKYRNGRRTFEFVLDKAVSGTDRGINADEADGDIIFDIRPLVDAQGYIFKYNYGMDGAVFDGRNRHIDLQPYIHAILAQLSYERLQRKRYTDALPTGAVP